MSFFHFFWGAASAVTDTPGRHFVAITDPATSLEALAEDRGFRRVFHAPQDVGGRYSALTEFGLVPAAMIGVDVRTLVERTLPFGAPDVFTRPIDENPGLALGAILGEAALAGRDKLTILATPGMRAFPAWIEQLVAESTGKDGKGIVPVLHEPVLDSYGDDRVFVSIELDGDPAPAVVARQFRHPNREP